MVLDIKNKKKEIYLPLKKIIELIIKRVEALDIHVPLSYIARMELDGKFNDESLVKLKKNIYNYLRTANEYRKIYFEFQKKAQKIFDREMGKDGSFAPGIKQYDSLRIQISEALLKTNGKVWITSYDQYLPTIREHADKRKKTPNSGEKMFKGLKSIFAFELKEIKRLQNLTLKKSKAFIRELRRAMKNPDLNWGDWLGER